MSKLHNCQCQIFFMAWLGTFNPNLFSCYDIVLTNDEIIESLLLKIIYNLTRRPSFIVL